MRSIPCQAGAGGKFPPLGQSGEKKIEKNQKKNNQLSPDAGLPN